MILKFHTRDRDGGWIFIDRVDRVETCGPITDAGIARVFHSQADLVAWAKTYWGDAAFEGNGSFAFVNWPVFRIGNEGCGGRSDAYTIVQATIYLDDDRVGLAFLGQDEAYLLSDAGHTIDRLR